MVLEKFQLVQILESNGPAKMPTQREVVESVSCSYENELSYLILELFCWF